MANITLKIDDALLEKARRPAFLKKTSINAVVKQRIEVTVHRFSGSQFKGSRLKELKYLLNKNQTVEPDFISIKPVFLGS